MTKITFPAYFCNIPPLFVLLKVIIHILIFSGWVNDFLSSKKFVPISRLSYAIYLVNFNLVSGYLWSLRTPFYITTFSLIICALGILLLTFVIAICIFILIEMPFQNIEKVWFYYLSSASSVVSADPKRQGTYPLDDG